MSITASVTAAPITASVTGGTISASVGSSIVTASAGGGVGPQGAQGVQGPNGGISSLSQASDVALSGTATGDVLRYSDAKWRNLTEHQITDGGNF